MKFAQSSQQTCGVCGETFEGNDVMPGSKVRSVIADLVRLDHPNWTSQAYICRDDLGHYTVEYLESLLQLEKGELATLGRDAIRSMQTQGLIALNQDQAFEKDWTLRQRLTDRLMKVAAIPQFMVAFCGVLGLAILLDILALYWRPGSGYGFIAINLLLTLVIAIQAPLIAMSQLPHTAKDRLRSEHSYLMNLKAEIGIRKLNQAVTDLVASHRQPLVEVQQALLMLLSRAEQQQPSHPQVGVSARH
jgi:uncharacterized membrane protein